MIVPLIEENVQVVAQLSIMNVCNQQSQKNDHICIAREDDKNILSCVDFSRLCCII